MHGQRKNQRPTPNTNVQFAGNGPFGRRGKRKIGEDALYQLSFLHKENEKIIFFYVETKCWTETVVAALEKESELDDEWQLCEIAALKGKLIGKINGG